MSLLSTISGVTVYASKAAALSGAVDSGAAFNTWMRAQTSSSAAPLTLEWDGWIYIDDMDDDYLQYTPTLTGYITHKPSVGMTSAGAVWAAKTTASPCLRNGAAVHTQSADNISDVTFTTNAGGVGLTFDFNYTSPQPHDDTTWGWAFGFVAAGVNRLTLNTVTFINACTFATQFVGGDGLFITDPTVTLSGTPRSNTDGIHVNGPYSNVYLSGGTFTATNDDAIALNADEPYDHSTLANYRAGLLADWDGGDITTAKIIDNAIDACQYGFRTLALKHKLDDILLDGLTGTVKGYIWNADNYDEVPTYAGGLARNHIGTITLRNINVQASGAHNAYKPSRLYIHADIDALYLDLTSVTPVSADGASTVPLFSMHLYSELPPVMVFGPAQNVIVQDNFFRANSATVGNGWTDVTGSKYSISGNALVTTGDGNTNRLVQAGTTMVNGMAVACMYLGASTGTGVGVIRHTAATTEYETACAGDGGTAQMYKVVAGSATLMKNVGGAVAGASDTVAIYAVACGSIILGGAYVANAKRWESPFTSVIDTAITAAGAGGLALNAPNSTQTFARAEVYEYVAKDTLTSITVEYAGEDDYGNHLFTATGNGNADVSVGTWATSSGTIDAFGRLRGATTATVTYTVGAIVGTLDAVAASASTIATLTANRGKILRGSANTILGVAGTARGRRSIIGF